MGKVFEYNKDNNEMWDVMPTMNDVEYELYLIETVKVMKLARNLLNELPLQMNPLLFDLF